MVSLPHDGLRIRPAVSRDVAPLCEILNVIIGIGGTTAYETPMTHAAFSRIFIDGENCLTCLVAEDARSAMPLGFQALSHYPGLPDGWADIGTFARVRPKVPGVGTVLFEHTKAKAAELGLIAINAVIRADNTGGLAYYEKMGFETYKVHEGVPLQDGTPVDRIFKRYLVRPATGSR
jgi:hypothetical protein